MAKRSTRFWLACGEIGPDVPLVNVRAMYEAFWQYGGSR